MHESRESTSGLEAHYAEFFGAISELLPELTHLHYGIADRPPSGLGGTLRELREGPARLSDEIVRVGRLAELGPGARGLDIGCGLAGTSLHLADVADLKMVGLDRSLSQLGRAARRVRSRGADRRVALAGGGATQLPFADGVFDLAVLVEVVFHVEDKQALLAELARVLRPGGRLIVVDQEMSEGAVNVLGFFHFMGPGELEAMAAAAGFVARDNVDLSARVVPWMAGYARAASYPAQLAMVSLALARGGPSLARVLARGLRRYHRLVVESGRKAGLQQVAGRFPNGIRAVREYTRERLEEGSVRYGLYVFEK